MGIQKAENEIMLDFHEMKYKFKVLTISIVGAMALTYAQIWGAAEISNKILWQVYLFFELVFPHGLSGHIGPGETVTIARLSPEYVLTGMIDCLILGIILYTYLFSKLISKMFPSAQRKHINPISNFSLHSSSLGSGKPACIVANTTTRTKTRTKVIAWGIGTIAFPIITFMPWILKFCAPHQYPVILNYGHITFNFAFNSPETMNPRDTAVIQLVLGLKTTIDDQKQKIEAAAEKSGERIHVPDRMEAHLSGSNFAIRAITPEVQDVSQSNLTEWQWEVKPSSDGRHDLHLTVSTLLSVDGVSPPKTIITFDQAIEVKTTWSQRVRSFFKKNWDKS